MSVSRSDRSVEIDRRQWSNLYRLIANAQTNGYGEYLMQNYLEFGRAFSRKPHFTYSATQSVSQSQRSPIRGRSVPTAGADSVNSHNSIFQGRLTGGGFDNQGHIYDPEIHAQICAGTPPFDEYFPLGPCIYSDVKKNGIPTVLEYSTYSVQAGEPWGSGWFDVTWSDAFWFQQALKGETWPYESFLPHMMPYYDLHPEFYAASANRWRTQKDVTAPGFSTYAAAWTSDGENSPWMSYSDERQWGLHQNYPGPGAINAPWNVFRPDTIFASEMGPFEWLSFEGPYFQLWPPSHDTYMLLGLNPGFDAFWLGFQATSDAPCKIRMRVQYWDKYDFWYLGEESDPWDYFAPNIAITTHTDWVNAMGRQWVNRDYVVDLSGNGGWEEFEWNYPVPWDRFVSWEFGYDLHGNWGWQPGVNLMFRVEEMPSGGTAYLDNVMVTADYTPRTLPSNITVGVADWQQDEKKMYTGAKLWFKVSDQFKWPEMLTSPCDQDTPGVFPNPCTTIKMTGTILSDSFEGYTEGLGPSGLDIPQFYTSGPVFWYTGGFPGQNADPEVRTGSVVWSYRNNNYGTTADGDITTINPRTGSKCIRYRGDYSQYLQPKLREACGVVSNHPSYRGVKIWKTARVDPGDTITVSAWMRDDGGPVDVSAAFSFEFFFENNTFHSLDEKIYTSSLGTTYAQYSHSMIVPGDFVPDDVFWVEVFIGTYVNSGSGETWVYVDDVEISVN